MTGLGFVLGDLGRRFREVKLFWVGCSQEVRAIMIAYFNKSHLEGRRNETWLKV